GAGGGGGGGGGWGGGGGGGGGGRGWGAGARRPAPSRGDPARREIRRNPLGDVLGRGTVGVDDDGGPRVARLARFEELAQPREPRRGREPGEERPRGAVAAEPREQGLGARAQPDERPRARRGGGHPRLGPRAAAGPRH